MGVFGMHGVLRPGNDIHASSELSSVRAKNKLRSDESKVKHLEATVAKILMINEALWEIIRDKFDMTDEDFHNKLYEVDMRDGQVDGKNQRKASKCPKCDHMVSSRHPACLYCGQVMDSSIFDME
ncbi:MAG: zinc ribbon domain-containing protein [Phycisphaerae bacterium]|nr:zinc ribbon domain-containing protein [Phycisphaerae bacterium]